MSNDGQYDLIVIGAGLAGSEVAWAAAQAGRRVRLYEMRPVRHTPAHRTDMCGELVCSNSFRSNAPDNAVGMLKEEMRRLGSLIMQVAEETKIPAGKGLAIDRERFAEGITARLQSHPLITLQREEVTSLRALAEQYQRPLVVASGPLTAEALAADIRSLTHAEDLYFYDSMAPLLATASLDPAQMFRASRYGVGEDYLNAPMSRAEYQKFVMAVAQAEKVPPRHFEDPKYFEGCLPIEVMAERGIETLRHGPMKPFGLKDPRTGREPYAVVQLRFDNRAETIVNMVGFQTRMTWPEQQRILRTITGLATAEFLRMGAMHRNTYLNAPKLLDPTFALRSAPWPVQFAGQITGVEGYVESAAIGLYVGLLQVGRLRSAPPLATALGALTEHVTNGNHLKFEPMNANWGLTPPLPAHVPYQTRKAAYRDRARQEMIHWLKEEGFAG
ncbi:MAG: methylenetetrahydrofolate--tRNA-(uracil(54)-C(5))-methyltransferase (FADH(2)-oxidizing) TrmFO [Deltaproteobacteria bacterium]|nr:methylenetetrahydrofolate--tRNA-(uracil(54)-C(5))-methyltransferase (FADH(2)-oxidizing) TrmFO [Deltaproteobacteria bacterium]